MTEEATSYGLGSKRWKLLKPVWIQRDGYKGFYIASAWCPIHAHPTVPLLAIYKLIAQFLKGAFFCMLFILHIQCSCLYSDANRRYKYTVLLHILEKNLNVKTLVSTKNIKIYSYIWK
jgi:hypothetical protein